MALVPPAAVGLGHGVRGARGRAAVRSRRRRRVLALAVCVSVAGSLAAVLLGSPRTYVALARDGLFPQRLARLTRASARPSRRSLSRRRWPRRWSSSAPSPTSSRSSSSSRSPSSRRASRRSTACRRPRRAPPSLTPARRVTPAVFIGLCLVLLGLLLAGKPMQALLGRAGRRRGRPGLRDAATGGRPAPESRLSVRTLDATGDDGRPGAGTWRCSADGGHGLRSTGRAGARLRRAYRRLPGARRGLPGRRARGAAPGIARRRCARDETARSAAADRTPSATARSRIRQRHQRPRRGAGAARPARLPLGGGRASGLEGARRLLQRDQPVARPAPRAREHLAAAPLRRSRFTRSGERSRTPRR